LALREDCLNCRWNSIIAAPAAKLSINLLCIAISLAKIYLVTLRLDTFGLGTDSIDSRPFRHRDSAAAA
jgi:hypothetical protein